MPFRIVLLVLATAALPVRALEPDDPRGRVNARLQMEGLRSLDEQVAILNAAAAEARKYGIGAQQKFETSAAVAGSAWVNVGPAGGSQVSPLPQTVTDAGRVRKIVPHPTDANILYVATAGGGVWKSFDAQAIFTTTTGPHWTSITSGIGSQSVGAFAIDPNSPDTLYLGLGDPFDVATPGFYTSLDGGISWSDPMTLGNTTRVRDIVVDPANTGVVLVAGDDGVYRSTQNGVPGSWAKASTIATDNCWSIAFIGPLTWEVACDGSVWRSTDDAASFSQVNLPSADVGRMLVVSAPSDVANPNAARVYLLAANGGDSDQGDVYRSSDGGRTWVSLNMHASATCDPTCPQPAYWTNDQPDYDFMHDQAWYNQAAVVDPRNRDVLFVGGNLAMMRTNDGGNTWYVVSDWLPPNPQGGAANEPYVHADFHAMAVSTTGGTAYFYAGTDGGLFRSSDVFSGVPSSDQNNSCFGGKCIHFETRLNRGIASHLVYSIATDLHDSSNPVMIGGLQDNGTRLRVASAPQSFNQVYGGDGFGSGIGIKAGASCASTWNSQWGSLLIATIYGRVMRSVDCGASFAPAMAGICGSPQQFTGDCSVDYNSNFFMKIASEPADTTGQTFVTVINDSDCSGAQCVSASFSNVFYTHDGAFSWTNSGTQFPSQLLFVGTNPKHAGQWAVTADSVAYTTTDGGAHWTASASLPHRYVTSVAFEGATGAVIWATMKGTSQTVMRSTDSGAHWTDKTGNLPGVPVNVVAVDPNDTSTIYLGTEIGLYRSQDGGSTWARYGKGLPLVSVTEINVALDSSAIRIATFGRGFWELTQSATAPSGVYGNGDLDRNQLLDGFDLVREAGLLGDTPQVDSYDAQGNLTGTTNSIDANDFAVLIARLGGRP